MQSHFTRFCVAMKFNPSVPFYIRGRLTFSRHILAVKIIKVNVITLKNAPVVLLQVHSKNKISFAKDGFWHRNSSSKTMATFSQRAFWRVFRHILDCVFWMWECSSPCSSWKWCCTSKALFYIYIFDYWYCKFFFDLWKVSKVKFNGTCVWVLQKWLTWG